MKHIHNIGPDLGRKNPSRMRLIGIVVYASASKILYRSKLTLFDPDIPCSHKSDAISPLVV